MLSAGAAPGPDGIPAKMIKAANTTFASMLNNIMQTSLDSGDIPGILKLAFVTPIHKGDSRSRVHDNVHDDMIMYAIMHDQHSVHSYDQHIIAMINSLS